MTPLLTTNDAHSVRSKNEFNFFFALLHPRPSCASGKHSEWKSVKEEKTMRQFEWEHSVNCFVSFFVRIKTNLVRNGFKSLPLAFIAIILHHMAFTNLAYIRSARPYFIHLNVDIIFIHYSRPKANRLGASSIRDTYKKKKIHSVSYVPRIRGESFDPMSYQKERNSNKKKSLFLWTAGMINKYCSHIWFTILSPAFDESWPN